MVGFKDAVHLYFEGYTDFKGRASRAEFWWPVLFKLMVVIVLLIPVTIAGALSSSSGPGPLMVFAALPLIVFLLAVFIPDIALFVRRLHDLNLTGWIYLGLFIALFLPVLNMISMIAQIVVACIPSKKGPNKYGDIPPQKLSGPVAFE